MATVVINALARGAGFRRNCPGPCNKPSAAQPRITCPCPHCGWPPSGTAFRYGACGAWSFSLVS